MTASFFFSSSLFLFSFLSFLWFFAVHCVFVLSVFMFAFLIPDWCDPWVWTDASLPASSLQVYPYFYSSLTWSRSLSIHTVSIPFMFVFRLLVVCCVVVMFSVVLLSVVSWPFRTSDRCSFLLLMRFMGQDVVHPHLFQVSTLVFRFLSSTTTFTFISLTMSLHAKFKRLTIRIHMSCLTILSNSWTFTFLSMLFRSLFFSFLHLSYAITCILSICNTLSYCSNSYSFFPWPLTLSDR